MNRLPIRSYLATLALAVVSATLLMASHARTRGLDSAPDTSGPQPDFLTLSIRADAPRP